MVDELGSIRRVVDGMVAKAARRVAETSERDGAAQIARLLGVGTGAVRGAIETAKNLEKLPETEAAVREGALSAVQAQMLAAAATKNPAAEQELLAVADEGMVPLRDACVRARAAVEDPSARAKRVVGYSASAIQPPENAPSGRRRSSSRVSA